MNLSSMFFHIAVFTSTVLAGRDFYKILGVPRNANNNQIKKAYRKLAKELHPDKKPGDEEAHEAFQDLGAAYECLVDPDKRKLYDRGGEEAVAKSNGGGGGGHDPFGSFFGDFFGFGGGGGGGHSDETPKGADIVFDLWVTLEELYNGEFVEVARNKALYKPASGTRQCNCRTEMRTQSMGPGRFQMFQERVCDDCPNVKLTTEERMLEIEVEPGMRDGQEQVFGGEGEPHIEGDPGDLKARIRTHKHHIFERRDDDLYVNVTLSLEQALNGFSVNIAHLDGHIVTVTRTKVTWPGARIRKQGEGMPNFEDNKIKGLLVITFDVEFPRTELNDEQRELVTKIMEQKEFDAKVYNGLQGF